MASALQQMNQAERAMDVLQILYRRYPDSSAARQSLKRDQPLENFKNKGIQ
jgi:TolA-binding protein